MYKAKSVQPVRLRVLSPDTNAFELPIVVMLKQPWGRLYPMQAVWFSVEFLDYIYYSCCIVAQCAQAKRHIMNQAANFLARFLDAHKL